MAMNTVRERRFTSCLVLAAAVLLLPASAAAQNSWEGNAAMIRRGEFSTPGLFAASNAFPVDSRVQVTNLQTGKQVEVTVVRRIDGAGTIFLLLSEQAAQRIGLSESEVARVRAAVSSSLEIAAPEPSGESPYSSDPDLNPAVSVDESRIAAAAAPSQPVPAAAEALPSAEPEGPPPVAPQSPAVEPSAEASEPGSEPGAVPPAPTQAVAGGQPAGPAAAVPESPALALSAGEEQSAEQRRLEELSERLPQKQLFLPPRQALAPMAPEPPPEVSEAPAAETEAVQGPEGEEVAAVEEQPLEEAAPEEAPPVAEVQEQPPAVGLAAPPGGEPPDEVQVELPGPAPAPAQEPVAEGTRLAAPEEAVPLSEEMPIAAPVAAAEEAAAPAVSTEPEPAAEEEPLVAAAAPTAQTAVLTALPRRSYFLQLGAYSTQGLADKLATQLRDRYEVVVLAADSRGRLFYKVLVGPLNRDESGTLLYQFRARGFKDAFVQYVE